MSICSVSLSVSHSFVRLIKLCPSAMFVNLMSVGLMLAGLMSVGLVSVSVDLYVCLSVFLSSSVCQFMPVHLSVCLYKSVSLSFALYVLMSLFLLHTAAVFGDSSKFSFSKNVGDNSPFPKNSSSPSSLENGRKRKVKKAKIKSKINVHGADEVR